jgi:5-methylcytosine-specific restriction endonuclease McrA
MHTEERRRRISEGVKRAAAEGRYRRGGWKCSDEQKAALSVAIKRAYLDKLMADDFDAMSLGRKRRRIVVEQNGACASCGLTEWLGSSIMLELDHRNGASEKREDLWAICPNCHSQTPTWRKSKQRRKNVASDEQILEALSRSTSIRQALVSLGMAGEGSNYKRARSLLAR